MDFPRFWLGCFLIFASSLSLLQLCLALARSSLHFGEMGEGGKWEKSFFLMKVTGISKSKYFS